MRPPCEVAAGSLARIGREFVTGLIEHFPDDRVKRGRFVDLTLAVRVDPPNADPAKGSTHLHNRFLGNADLAGYGTPEVARIEAVRAPGGGPGGRVLWCLLQGLIL